jgi:hypothetical protein
VFNLGGGSDIWGHPTPRLCMAVMKHSLEVGLASPETGRNLYPNCLVAHDWLE